MFELKSFLELMKYCKIIESAIPLDGVFDVKLAKRGNSLGIVVRSEAENTKGEPVIISDVQVGSVAYRWILTFWKWMNNWTNKVWLVFMKCCSCGSLRSGDCIFAVDNVLLEACTVEEAMRLLQRSGDIVKLRVRKSSTSKQVHWFFFSFFFFKANWFKLTYQNNKDIISGRPLASSLQRSILLNIVSLKSNLVY